MFPDPRKMISMEVPSWLAKYAPTVPLESLVEEVNKIFHSFDAAFYDGEHPEIHKQLPTIWSEMIAQLPDCGPWNALDLGCGTGFEAEMALDMLGDKVTKITAFDPSPEMMAICKTRLERSPRMVFCSQIEEACHQGPFNLLLTNSLLHHLPNIEKTVESLLPSLTPEAVWLAGHEPSSRYYRNDKCLKLYERYCLHRKYAKWFDLSSYTTKLRLLLGRHPLSATAGVAYKRGLFLTRPDPAVISKIVDFHVAHSADEVTHGRGLDIEKMKVLFERDWVLRWSKTYSYLGPFGYARVPNMWAQEVRELEQRFPADGANFSMVWQRKQNSSSFSA
jgi:SAM-dependent methyltransferase